jgi:hypothetical protein
VIFLPWRVKLSATPSAQTGELEINLPSCFPETPTTTAVATTAKP